MGENMGKTKGGRKRKSLGALLALSVATILGIIFWRRRRSF
jgi:hypothetical protein